MNITWSSITVDKYSRRIQLIELGVLSLLIDFGVLSLLINIQDVFS